MGLLGMLKEQYRDLVGRLAELPFGGGEGLGNRFVKAATARFRGG